MDYTMRSNHSQSRSPTTLFGPTKDTSAASKFDTILSIKSPSSKLSKSQSKLLDSKLFSNTSILQESSKKNRGDQRAHFFKNEPVNASGTSNNLASTTIGQKESCNVTFTSHKNFEEQFVPDTEKTNSEDFCSSEVDELTKIEDMTIDV